MSPLIFALAIEPLAEAIRGHNNIAGFQIKSTSHKTALYADDILLFITSPEKSIPALMSAIQAFGSFSGYKINFSKSMAMPVGYGDNVPNIPNFPFHWSVSGFSYLGISVSQNMNSLLRRNFSSVHKDIKSDLNRWMDLPITWTGRINLIKMNVLPRLLYIMQMLPLYITKEIFQNSFG